MSVTITVNVGSLSGGLTPGAYILVTLLNCGSSPTVVNTSTTVPITQKFLPLNGTAVCTIYDNITQIACDGNMLSFYQFSLVSGGVTTFIKNVELPPGTFNLANLANVTTPPWQAGVIQGPAGPPGPASLDGTPFHVQLIGTINGVNQLFSFPFGNTPSLLMVFQNGLKVSPFANAPQGYTTIANTVSFNAPPQISDGVPDVLEACGVY
jgi:hypothetical protein